VYLLDDYLLPWQQVLVCGRNSNGSGDAGVGSEQETVHDTDAIKTDIGSVHSE